MRENFDLVQGWIGLSEGGFVNHPKDPGGATDRGITQATFDAWNRLHGYPQRAVRGISRETAEAIIAEQYLEPIRFNDLPAGLDYAVADFAVNSGPSRAAQELQALLGVEADGVIGVKTLAAIRGKNIPPLVIAYCAERMGFLRRLSTWRTFGGGWTARVEGREPGVQPGDIGVVDRAVRLAQARKDIPAPTVAAPGKAAPAPAQGLWPAILQFLRRMF